MDRAEDVLTSTQREIRRIAECGRSVYLWVRDDDFVTYTSNFQLLAELAKQGVPTLIAAVPWRFKLSLGDQNRLRHIPNTLRFCVHGFNHTSHGVEAGGPTEYPSNRDPSSVTRELNLGRSVVEDATGERFLPIFVPPWNYMAPRFISSLSSAGFRSLSASDERPDGAQVELPQINTSFDVLRYGADIYHKMRTNGEIDQGIAHYLASSSDGEADVYLGLLSHHTAMGVDDIRRYIYLVTVLSKLTKPLPWKAFFDFDRSADLQLEDGGPSDGTQITGTVGC